MEKKPISHIAAGAIIGAAMVIYTLLIQFTGQATNKALGFLSLLIIVGMLIYFIIQYGKANGDTLTFGKLFVYGFKATALIALIVGLFNIVFYMVFPEYKEANFDMTRTEMLKNPQITEAQVDSIMEGYQKNFMLILVGSSLIGTLVIGVIASLIGAGVAKKTPQTPFQQP